MSFKAGDVVRNKTTGRQDTVLSVSGMSEYDRHNFADAVEGMVLANGLWEYQSKWELVSRVVTGNVVQPLTKQTTKYKVGDKVRVRHDLNYRTGWYAMAHDSSIKDGVTDSMIVLRGKLVTIVKARDNYQIAEDGETWNWTDEMFIDPSHTTPKQDKSNRVKLGRWGMRYKETRIR